MAKTTVRIESNVRVTLHLNEEEAAVLEVILTRIGGQPENTYRGVSDEILRSLRTANVDSNVLGSIQDKLDHYHRSIYFV